MKNKRPKDIMQLAKLIGEIATGEREDTISESKKHPVPPIKKKAGKKS